MKILNKKSIKLPFIGKDMFVRLMRAGLGYKAGSYFVKNYNNLEKMMDIISDIFGEKVSFLQACVLCGEDFSCSNCKYQDQCATRDLPLHCICGNCR